MKFKQADKRAAAVAGLVLTTIIWGGGFVITKIVVESVTPVYLMAFRFSIAAAGLVLCFHKKIKLLKKRDILPGAILGLWLAISFITQTYGIMYTTASNNAFITAFYVILVPFLSLILCKTKLRPLHIFTAVMALSGIAMLSLTETFQMRAGDALTLLCSLMYAVHIVLLGRYAAKHDVIILTMLQMFAAAALCWICAPVFEGPFAPALSAGIDLSFCLSILYLALLSTMLGFLFQTAGQKYLPTHTVSVLLTLESVFGASFSVLLLGDPLTPRIIAGFAVMFAAVLISVRAS